MILFVGSQNELKKKILFVSRQLTEPHMQRRQAEYNPQPIKNGKYEIQNVTNINSHNENRESNIAQQENVTVIRERCSTGYI